MIRYVALMLGLTAATAPARECEGILLPSRHVVLSTLAGGVVISLPYREGQYVKEGTVLLAMDPTKDSLQLILAQRSLEKSRIRKRGVVESEVDLRLRQIALGELTIKAPFSGTIAKIDAKEHEYYSAGTKVIELVDLSALMTEIHVSSAEVETLKKRKNGITVFKGNNEVPGRYYAHNPLGEPGVGLFLVKIGFTNSRSWDPGTYVKVRF